MRKKIVLYSFTSVVLLLGIIILTNLIASYIYFRIDFTSGNVYSLSKASKRLLKNLDDYVVIKAYFSKNLPVEYANNKKYLEDMLKIYRSYSRRKVKFEFIDPKEKDILQEIHSIGIPPIRFTQIERDKYEVKEGYMGLCLLYGDKREIIPVVKGTEGLEFDITSKIKKLTAKETKKISFTTGHDEVSSYDLGPISESLANQYSINTINLKENKVIDGEALIIFGPKKKFTEEELLSIDQFILQGKPVAFLIDTFNIDLNNFWARKLDLGLDDFLAHFGIKIKPGFVLDFQNQRIVLRSVQGFFTVENVINYPLFPVATKFKKDNPIVKDLEEASFPFISPIELAIESKGLKGEILIESSPRSWYRDNLYYVNPFADMSPRKEDKKGPFGLAAVVSGKFRSYFADKMKEGIITQAEKVSRIIVVPNSLFVKQGSQGSAVFFVNLIDWLVQDEDLIAIRSKGATFRLLKELPHGIKLLVKYINIFFMPICIVIYGVIRWRIRQQVKKSMVTIYG